MLNKQQRNLILYLQSFLEDPSLQKSDPFSLHVPESTRHVIVPFYEGNIGNEVYCAEEDIKEIVEVLNSSMDRTFLVKSFIVQDPTQIIEQKVWITLPTQKTGCNTPLESILPTNVLQTAILEAVSQSLSIDMQKAISRAGGSFVLDTSDALPYIETSVFRFLDKAVAGMTDGETREIKFPTSASDLKISIKRQFLNGYILVINDGEGKEIHNVGPYILPLIAAEIMHYTGWYSGFDTESSKEHTIIPDIVLSNQELGEGLDQILSESRAETAVAAISTIESNLQSPTPNIQEIYNLIKILQADVLGLQSKIGRISELSEQEIDAIQSSMSILRNSKQVTINVGT